MKIGYGKQNIQSTGQIYDGTCIRQYFTASENYLTSVELYFILNVKVQGNLIVDICDNNLAIKSVKIDTSRLPNCDYKEIGVGVDLTKNRTYELKIYTECCRAGYSFECAYGDKTTGDHFFIGSRLRGNGELTVNFNYESKSSKKN